MDTQSREALAAKLRIAHKRLNLLQVAVFLFLGGQVLYGFAYLNLTYTGSATIRHAAEFYGEAPLAVAAIVVSGLCIISTLLDDVRVWAGLSYAAFCFSMGVSAFGVRDDFFFQYAFVYPWIGIAVAASSWPQSDR